MKKATIMISVCLVIVLLFSSLFTAVAQQEKPSYVTLDTTIFAIPVGQTATVKINDLHLAQSQYEQVGAYVWVNHQEMTYEQFCQAVNGWVEGAFPLAMYREDYAYLTYTSDWWEFHHYNGDKEASYFNGTPRERLNTQSPMGEYLIVVNEEQMKGKPLDSLWNIGVLPRRLVYNRVANDPVAGQWLVEHPEVVTVTNTDVDIPDLYLTATVVGEQEGETTLTFEYSDGTQFVTASCFIKVYEPAWPQPAGWGDVNADGVVNAKDALAVLRYSAHPFLHFGDVTKETLMEYEKAKWQMVTIATLGEVSGDGRRDAKDALEILKYAVKKITKFPVEDMVTPTNI